MLQISRKINPSLVDHFFGNNLFDNFFGNNIHFSDESVPAVNISESNDNFKIEIAAPGLEKQDYNVSVHNDLLTISCEKKKESEEKNEKFVRKEFNYSSFKRSFILPESANADLINASYKDGILNIVIPKMEELKEKEPRSISIN